MALIYLITVSGGQWEDAYTTNLAATTDKSVAEAYIHKLKTEDEIHKSIVKKLNEVRDDVENELGKLEFIPRIERPKWDSGLGKAEITQTMINARKKVELKNQLISRQNQILLEARQCIIDERRAVLLTSMGFAPDHEYFTNRYPSTEVLTYDIDEVEFLEVKNG